MAKLQLYINKSLRGYKNLVNINPEEEISRHVHDYRHALEAIVYDHSRSNVFFLVTDLEKGILLTVLRTVAGSGADDHLAATVFIPAGMAIAPDGLISLCDSIATALPADGNDLTAEAAGDLRLLFSKDYPVADDAPVRLPSAGRAYACAFYGRPGLSLRDYASRSFIIPGAPSYAGVLLIDGARAADTTADITCSPLPATTVLRPARATREGFAPYIAGHPFTHPVLLPSGYEVEIQWRHPGFNTVNRIVTTGTGDNVVDTPDTSQARKTISPSSFYITEQGTQRSIGSFMIKVNNIDIDEPHSFTYAELHDAKVEISSPGYFAFSGHLDLASSTQALVQMKQLHRTYRFDLPLNTPDPVEAIRIYLKTKKPITECPIEGYEVTGEGILEGAGVSNSMIYVGGTSRRLVRYAIAGSVLSLLLGFFIGWLAFHSTPSAPHPAPAPVVAEVPAATQPQPAPVAETPEPVEETAAAPDYAVAAAYLDANKSWARADMEAIPGLTGLFDDLNTYNFDRILTYWAPLLDSSANFRTVVKAVAGSVGKRSPDTGEHSPAYVNNADDASIHWRSYTYWVDP